MKKLLLSLTLMGALATIPTISCMANMDSPNDIVKFKKTSVEEVSETSIFVEDTIEPKCPCADDKCKEEKNKDNEKEACPKPACPKEEKKDENKEVCPKKLEESKKIEKQN